MTGHGRSLYRKGCRCSLCTRANSDYSRDYLRRRVILAKQLATGADDPYAGYNDNGTRRTYAYVPFAPLLQRIAGKYQTTADAVTAEQIAETCGVDRRTVHRWKANGFLSDRKCDTIAIRMGWHPAAIWGIDWYIETYAA